MLPKPDDDALWKEDRYASNDIATYWKSGLCSLPVDFVLFQVFLPHFFKFLSFNWYDGVVTFVYIFFVFKRLVCKR